VYFGALGFYDDAMAQRRSRMIRTKTGKRIALSPRDLELFRLLARYRYLRSTYLHAFVGGASETRFKERLGDLFHEGFLDRPEEQWRFADCRFLPVVHELGKGGHDALLRADGGLPDAVTWLGDGAQKQFEHAHLICAVLASIELVTRSRADIRFIPWPEMLAKAPESTRQSAKPFLLSYGSESVVPDALFGLEYRHDGRKSFRFFALEADRGTMPISRASNLGTSVLAKLGAYRNILAREVHRTKIGIPNLLVLTVTTDRDRCSEIVRRFGERVGEAPQFLFQAITDSGVLVRPNSGLLSAAWDRPYLAALRIDR
jgi:hypothetical protein